VRDRVEILCGTHGCAPDIFCRAKRQISGQTAKAWRTRSLPSHPAICRRLAVRLAEARHGDRRRFRSVAQMISARMSRFSRRYYSSIVGLGEFVFRFRRSMRCALGGSSFTISKSKTASNRAATVNHPQTIQNRINQIRCSRGLSVVFKNVVPKNRRASATRNRINIVLRRVV